MIRPPPISTRTDTLLPYPTLFRSEDEAFALPAGDKVALGDQPFIAGQDHRISASESSFPRRRESMNTASYEYGNPASIISGHRRSWIPAFAGMTVKGITR